MTVPKWNGFSRIIIQPYLSLVLTRFVHAPALLESGRGSTLKGKNLLRWENSFLYELNPIYMGGNNENDRVVFPESVLIHLKIYGCTTLFFPPFIKQRYNL